MPIVELITSSGLGSLLGMRHALEPDHLTAVSTLVSEGHTSRRAAMLGVCCIAFGLWQQARMEEGFLKDELGADAYEPYCRRVPMLVPFLPQN